MDIHLWETISPEVYVAVPRCHRMILLDMEQWCTEQFGSNTGGPPGRRWWTVETVNFERRFCFRKENDRTLFLLKWK